MPEEPDKLANAEALAITALSTWLGFPLPPTVAKNAFQAFNALVTGLVAVPAAYLNGWAENIRATFKAQAAFKEGAVSIALQSLGGDADLAKRAALSLGGRMLREQHARENVVRGALGELKVNPPIDEAPSAIDEDWLHMFARHAETKTNEDVQAYFAKVLAGEIRKPGSFSPATIEVLSRMTPRVGALFQRCCGLMITLIAGEPFLLCEPFGAPGANALALLGFDYQPLAELQEAGLLRTDMTSYKDCIPALFGIVDLAGQQFLFEPSNVSDNLQNRLRTDVIRCKALFLTNAGIQLRRIVHMTPNEAYVKRFIEWVEAQGLVRVQEPGELGNALLAIKEKTDHPEASP